MAKAKKRGKYATIWAGMSQNMRIGLFWMCGEMTPLWAGCAPTAASMRALRRRGLVEMPEGERQLQATPLGRRVVSWAKRQMAAVKQTG